MCLHTHMHIYLLHTIDTIDGLLNMKNQSPRLRITVIWIISMTQHSTTSVHPIGYMLHDDDIWNRDVDLRLILKLPM